MEIDENIFMECRIIGDTYRIEDNESEHTKDKPIGLVNDEHEER